MTLFFSVTAFGQLTTTLKNEPTPLPSSQDTLIGPPGIKITKLADGSGWFASKYDARGILQACGTFLDEKMTMPHGRFKYFTHTSADTSTRYNYQRHQTDTTFEPAKTYLSTLGYFSHGEKSGQWTDFGPTGAIIGMATFEHNKLNGPYQTYNTSTGKLSVEGQFVNGIREGSWNLLSFEGDTMSTDIYKKGEVVKTISHLDEKKFRLKKVKDAYPKYNFIGYLNSHLNKTGVSGEGTRSAMYSFTIDTAGHITNPSVAPRNSSDHQMDIEVDTTIIDVILQAPAWIPAVQSKQKVEMEMAFNLDVEYDKKHVRVSETKYPHNAAKDAATDMFNNSNASSRVGH
ncbi:hypothetical protein BEL04_14240 [Mucilaginibacter sp. PPCGB 2223]|nr:hypothetical protein BEL04_14240 [Mucilaginibacter sp. PPCGB 2223]